MLNSFKLADSRFIKAKKIKAQDLNPRKYPVFIEDIIVTSALSEVLTLPRGEFGHLKEKANNQITRLYTLIADLVGVAAKRHKEQNCNVQNNLMQDKGNHITRLITNEFLFYTHTPLTIDEFRDLTKKIEDLIVTLPSNLHFILSSFAVKTLDNRLMNLVYHIECGKSPKVQWFVKSTFSDLDPVYYETDELGNKSALAFVTNPDILRSDHKGFANKIESGGLSFGFLNVFECETEGGAKFYSCVDICVDHSFGIAKITLNEILRRRMEIAKKSSHLMLRYIQVSQVVTSNSIQLKPKNTLGRVTHADPRAHLYYSLQNSLDKLPPAEVVELMSLSPDFGTPIHIKTMKSQSCSILPLTDGQYEPQHTVKSEEIYQEKTSKPDIKTLANILLKIKNGSLIDTIDKEELTKLLLWTMKESKYLLLNAQITMSEIVREEMAKRLPMQFNIANAREYAPAASGAQTCQSTNAPKNRTAL